MASDKGYTMVHIKVDTHSKLKDYCTMNHLKMGAVIEMALSDYLSNKTEYDIHKAQALGKTKLFEEMYQYIQQISKDAEVSDLFKISKDEGTN
jgi:hypothetical protein